MNACASGLVVVTGKWTRPMPGIAYALCRGPSLNASPWTEWPAAGRAGFASVEVAVGRVGSSPRATVTKTASEATVIARVHHNGIGIDGSPVFGARILGVPGTTAGGPAGG